MGLLFGSNYEVEFEPQSLWYEASLTIAAQALKMGLRTDYRTLTHSPSSLCQALTNFGLDLDDLHSLGLFRLIDSFSVQQAHNSASRTDQKRFPGEQQSLKINEWAQTLRNQLKNGIPEIEMNRIHITDDFSVLGRYNDWSSILDVWRTAFIPWVEATNVTMFHGLLAGTYPDPFSTQMEGIADGLIDFRSWEQEGRVEHHMRIRVLCGMPVDSRWRHLQLIHHREVRVTPAQAQQQAAKPEAPPPLTPMMDFLARVFIDDYMHRRLELQHSGWRSLPDIAKTMKIPQSQVYGDPRYGHTFGRPLNDLVRGGLVEFRNFHGPGRGGNTLKVRISYEKEPVKRLVDAIAVKPSQANAPQTKR